MPRVEGFMPHPVGTPALALSGADWRPAIAVAAAVLLALFGGGSFEVVVAILAVARTAWVYTHPGKVGKGGLKAGKMASYQADATQGPKSFPRHPSGKGAVDAGGRSREPGPPAPVSMAAQVQADVHPLVRSPFVTAGTADRQPSARLGIYAIADLALWGLLMFDLSVTASDADVWEEMRSNGLTPTVVTYTSLIGAMGQSQHPEKAWEFYEAMKASQIEPNYITFGKLLHACSRSQSVDKADMALGLYKDMGERGIQADSYTFGALISACRDKYPQKVTELYAEMRRLGVAPDAGTYSTVISACDRSAQTGRAAQVFSSMKQQGGQSQSNLGAYNAMINACGRGDKTLDDALALLKEMQTTGPAPDAVTYSTVMKLCERARRPEDALQVFDAMCKSGCTVDRICCNWALSACEQLRNVERALALFDYMKKSLALEPDASTYGLLISACGKCKWGNKAAELFQELQDNKLVPNRFVYNAMIGACGNVKRIGMALDTFRTMKEEGVAPDAITFNSLISACEKRMWPERATELLREMEESGPAPDVKAYTALMSCWAKSKEPEKALDVYREMIGKGIEANAITFSTLAWACEKSGQTSLAKEFNLKEVESLHSCSAKEIRTIRQHSHKRLSDGRSASTASQLCEPPSCRSLPRGLISVAGKAPKRAAPDSAAGEGQDGFMPHPVGTPALALSGADWRPAIAVAAAVLLALFGGGSFEVVVAILAVARTAWVYTHPGKVGKGGLKAGKMASYQADATQGPKSFPRHPSGKGAVDAGGRSREPGPPAPVSMAAQVQAESRESRQADGRRHAICQGYVRTITEHAKNKRCGEALELLDDMRRRSVPPNTSVYTALISACDKGKQQERAMELFDEMKAQQCTPNAVTYNALISACGRGSHPERALEVWEEMRSNGLTPTVVTYTSLIGAMGQSQHPEKAWEFYEAMKASQIEPNYITFGKLLHACSRSQSVDKADMALGLYKDMGERGIQADSYTFGALISACRDKYPQKVTELYAEMRRLGVAPDAGTYSTVISACDRSAQTGRAAQVFSSMKQQGGQSQSNLGAYNAMINACGRGDKTLDDALALLKEMQTTGPAPDAVTYSTVMKLCERARRPEDALQVFDAMCKSGCTVDRICCNWALSACEQLRNVERALALFDYMKKSLALEPDASTYGLLISACGKCKWGNKAAELFQELQDNKLVPNRFVYNAMIGACGNVKRIGMALDTFRTMKEEGVAPDAITFNSLISACEKRMWPERATELLREMEESGPAPDVKAYTALMSCWAKSKEPEKALDVYREMIGKGIEANAITFSTLAWACEKSGQTSLAKEFNLKEVESLHSCSAKEIRTIRQHSHKRLSDGR
ncbi:unnamed protein product [Prorocentrum cordatum]|uniref:PROP1-like PPR domain-containing protein n=1 Tax=Prorocentrum cordatum TaxID=2364126 RepID=A0ABN9TFF9_9DINO|nr:unnamed protein product [Polarella glacialis]